MEEVLELLKWLATLWPIVLSVLLATAIVVTYGYDLGVAKRDLKTIKDKKIVEQVETLTEWKSGLEKKGIVTDDRCGPLQRNCQDVLADRLLAGDKLLAERLAYGDEQFGLIRSDMKTLHEAVAANSARQDRVLEILSTVQMRHKELPARKLHGEGQ